MVTSAESMHQPSVRLNGINGEEVALQVRRSNPMMITGAATGKRSLEEGSSSPKPGADAEGPDQSSKRPCTGSAYHASARAAALAEGPDGSKAVIGTAAATQANGAKHNAIPYHEGISGQPTNSVPASKTQAVVAVGTNVAAQASAVPDTASAGRSVAQAAKQVPVPAMQAASAQAGPAPGHAPSKTHVGVECGGVQEGGMEGDASQGQSLEEIEQQACPPHVVSRVQ
jgi:hypothetical protein